MINYIIQVVLFQVLFLAIYDLFLSKETFFTKNRWYLLSTPILSFLLPLVKIPTFKKVVPQEYIVYLPEIILSPEKVIQETSWYPSVNYIDVLFGFGVIIFSVLFLAKLLQIINLIRSYKRTKKDGYTLVLIPKQTKAFSFFNYIFLGDEIPDAQKEQVIAHELVHSKQKHSLDLLFFEVLKIVMWFNPMIFIYQKRITLVHEYISDEVATKSAPKENYINQLLSNFFQVEDIAFINQFYKQTLIKKRIIMMKKKQSKKMNQLKYLVLIPVLISMLFYTSCSETEIKEDSIIKEKQKVFFKGKTDPLELTNESYFDIHIGSLNDGKELTYSDLKPDEKEEYDKFNNKFGKGEFSQPKIFKGSSSRKLLVFNNDEIETKTETASIHNKDGSVNFLTIEEAPTFPGCDSGDKDCFSKMIQKHFKRDFNTALPNQLGLSAGKKRVFVGFKVNENGDVVGIQARGPHKKIEEEIIRVMNTLPKMKPGKHEGKKVAVSYNIPLAVVIE